jgi:hypothetical protein
MQWVFFFSAHPLLNAFGLFYSLSILGWLQLDWTIFYSVHPWLDAMKMRQIFLLVTGGFSL